MTRVVITDLAPHIHEVRLHDGDRLDWHTGFNVTELDDGKTLRVSLFTGKVPRLHWWIAQAAKRFPKAERAVFSRLEVGGLRDREVVLKPGTAEIIASAQLAGGRL